MCSESSSLRFSAKERQSHDATTRGFGLAQCSGGRAFTDGDAVGPKCRKMVSPDIETQAHMPNTASDGLAPSAFDPSLEYSTDKVVLFWQPLSFFSEWSPSSFVVDDVSCSCAQQFMMA